MKTVVIVEDNIHVANSFEEIINSNQDYKVIGNFDNAEEAFDSFSDKQPDIVLMDIKLKGKSGIDGIREIKSTYPKVQCMVISVHEEANYIFKALTSGAVGYLTKNTSPEELTGALNELVAGGSPMSSSIARKVISFFQTPTHSELSERENEVLQLLSMGKSYAVIAKELHLSVNTIKTHTRNIYEKMHVSSKQELIRKIKGV